MLLKFLLTIILLSPLFGAVAAGLFGRRIGRRGAHTVTIFGVAVSTILSAYVFWLFIFEGHATYNVSLYTWLVSDGIKFEIGYMIDRLSATMMLVVTFVSLMVHIYTIGYMDHDEDYDHNNPYYQRFFSYISLFTFSMLSLVMANKLPAVVLRLGSRGLGVLLVDRFLHETRIGDSGQFESLLGEPCR